MASSNPTPGKAAPLSASPPPVLTSAPAPLTSSLERLFPTLSPAQVARIAAHGRRRRVQAGEVLVEASDPIARFFVVVSGEVEVVRVNGANVERVAVLGPGQFTGELTLLSGRRALARIRASAAGEAIEVDREQLAVEAHRRARVAGFLLGELGGRAQGVGAALRVALGLGALLPRGDQRLPVAACGADVLEHLHAVRGLRVDLEYAALLEFGAQCAVHHQVRLHGQPAPGSTAHR